MSPLDQIVTTVLLVAVALVVLAWITWHAVGEVRLSREYARPASAEPLRPTVLRRIDPPPTTTAATVASASAELAEAARLLDEMLAEVRGGGDR